MWTLLREVSLRHLRQSPLRTALVVFGIALGVCMLCAVLATNASLVAAFEDMVARVAGRADLTVAGSEAGVPGSLTGDIADVDGVAHAAAMLEVVTRTPRGELGALLVLGVDLLGDTHFLPFAQEGKHQVVEDPLVFVNDPTAILISKKLAQTRGLRVGSTLPLVTSEGEKAFTVRGLLENEGPAASFGGQVVVMFLDAAQVSFARGYAVDRIDIALKEGADVEAVRARIEKRIAGRAQVEEPRGRAQRLVMSLWAFKNGLNVSGLVALWVGMFLIYNAVSVSVAQRRREVGVLRALGVTRRRMVLLFCAEALIMASAASVLGLAMARQLARFALDSVSSSVNQFMLPARLPSPELSRDIIAIGIVAGLGTTLLAAYLPARQTTHVSPSEALRASRASSMLGTIPWARMAWLGAAIAGSSGLLAARGSELDGYIATLVLTLGLALLAPAAIKLLRFALVALVERWLGVPGRLALDNVERSLSRSAVTVVALMLAVALSMTVGSYARSFERSIVQWADDAFFADAMVTAGSPLVDRQHVSFGPGVLDVLLRTPGVAAANPTRITLQDLYGKRPELAAMDTRTYLAYGERRHRGRRILEGPAKLDAAALTGAPRVVVSENLAALSGLSAGDTLTLTTPSGPRRFEIHAVVTDYSSDQGWLLVDRRWYQDYWKDEQIDSVDLFFAPGVGHEQVAREVRKRLGDTEALFVTSQAGVRDQIQAAGRNLFAIARAPELITLIVAIMGVIGTMLAAVIDRVRELGMLRAVGALRAQVVKSVVAEAAFLGVAAVACGILAGIPQGYILLKVIGKATSGWDLPYGFPLETAVRMALSVVAAAALAGFLPGKRASAMDVKEALAYE